MHIDFNKNLPPYFSMYNLQYGIQFETVLISNTENGNFKHSDYQAIYITVFLTVNVFDCDITRVHCEGTVCECDHYLKFVLYCSNEINILGYISTKLKTMFFYLIFLVLFTLPFVLSFYKTIKYLNSYKTFSKISHSLPTAHIKIDYTFHRPCLHGLGF